MSDVAAVSARIRQLEKHRWAALVGSDCAALRELFADRMTYTHSNAMVDTKDSYIRAIEDGTVTYVAVEPSDEEVRVFGHAAVVTGCAVIDARAGGREQRTRARYSAVWAQEDGRWRFVCWHSTPQPV
ncbi:nuclear transport factor 2 family protein [Streptomyces sp. NPDC050625]|uniref:nuclear transport factor 2 family protein n=1 Tax=Streptomyces sp. NPDC050625 TaxID=3154629 RepID=UPI003448B8E2